MAPSTLSAIGAQIAEEAPVMGGHIPPMAAQAVLAIQRSTAAVAPATVLSHSGVHPGDHHRGSVHKARQRETLRGVALIAKPGAGEAVAARGLVAMAGEALVGLPHKAISLVAIAAGHREVLTGEGEVGEVVVEPGQQPGLRRMAAITGHPGATPMRILMALDTLSGEPASGVAGSTRPMAALTRRHPVNPIKGKG